MVNVGSIWPYVSNKYRHHFGLVYIIPFGLVYYLPNVGSILPYVSNKYWLHLALSLWFRLALPIWQMLVQFGLMYKTNIGFIWPCLQYMIPFGLVYPENVGHMYPTNIGFIWPWLSDCVVSLWPCLFNKRWLYVASTLWHWISSGFGFLLIFGCKQLLWKHCTYYILPHKMKTF
jgi:hypothetical protein